MIIRIPPQRLFTKAEAAHYCRRSATKFEVECPVSPVIMPGGDRLWDVQDLDKWIDGLKVTSGTADEILAKLR
ncbi:MAG: hypothetical protein ACLP4V_20185 [Methylocella sp.]